MAKLKIIFVDGGGEEMWRACTSYKLHHLEDNEMLKEIFASKGYSSNYADYRYFLGRVNENQTLVIITNAIHLLQHLRIDPKNKNSDELWLFLERDFINVCSLYENIRPENNLMKMYMGGMFYND